MRYTLLSKNHQIFDFELDEEAGAITDIYELKEMAYLPVGIETVNGHPSRKSVNQWWKGRGIPASRMGLEQGLEIMGVQSSELLLEKSYGLSLTDPYWVRPLGKQDLTWERMNFFENHFSNDVGEALFGNRDSFHGDMLSPCNTSDGWLKKKWIVQDGKGVLLKGGSGTELQEPLNESFANIVCQRLGIQDYIKYELMFEEDAVLSACENFVTPAMEFVTALSFSKLKKKNNSVSNFQHFIELCTAYGMDDCKKALSDIMVLDYVICNGDRHWNNFGVLRDTETLQFIGLAPIFDNGTSLKVGVPDFQIQELNQNPSKMFRKTLEEQMQFVTELNKYPLNNLQGLDEELNEILRKSPFITTARRDALTLWFGEHIKTILNL